MKTLRKSFIRKKPLRKASSKAQSAMEYLMTYGWAILIVAVVLGALYSLGVFNGAAFLGTSCISASGFYCTNPTLSTGGVLTVTIGQATGTIFKNTYLYFVPSGTNFTTSDPSTSIGTFNSGQQVTVSIPLGIGSPYPTTYTVGTPISGYLYLQFTDIYGITEVNKIATVLTKVTASSGGATFSKPTIPSGIVAYVPIIITNSQSSATPSPFQQMIQINEGNYANYITYNGNVANFEFFTQSGQILPAWIESNNSGTLTVWVNLPNGIPASSSLTIYLGFASKTTNLLSNSGTSGIGEAPGISSTYGAYDDGTNVFLNYFSGTSLSGWTTNGIAGQTTSAPSGNPTFGTNAFYANGGNGDYLYTTASGQSTNMIIEFYGYTANLQDLYFLVSSTGAGQMMRDGNGGGWYGIASTASWTSWSAPPGTGSWYNEWVTVGVVVNGGTAIGYLIPGVKTYGAEIGSNPTNQYTVANNGNFIGLVGDAASGSTTQYWSGIIIRAYPPSGVMPSVSFGGLSTA